MARRGVALSAFAPAGAVITATGRCTTRVVRYLCRKQLRRKGHVLMKQSECILEVLEAAGRNFLVERTPTGWRVETEQTERSEGLSCEGHSLRDCLGQVTQVLALELDLEVGCAWLHDALPDGGGDIDMPIGYELEPALEFCCPIPMGEEYARAVTGMSYCPPGCICSECVRKAAKHVAAAEHAMRGVGE